jgi:hypothetical protein
MAGVLPGFATFVASLPIAHIFVARVLFGIAVGVGIGYRRM